MHLYAKYYRTLIYIVLIISHLLFCGNGNYNNIIFNDHRLEARTATSPGSGETGATYQDPNTITCTPHPTTGETYTDVNLDKKKKTKEEDAGPMYQVAILV